MHIVIPMAGNSERFRRAGYTVPKQFMPIDGRPMCHRVCEMFSQDDEFVFIVQRAHWAVPEYRDILTSAVPRYTIIEIDPHDMGPIQTALAADPVIDDDEPVIFTYCDFYQHWDYRKFLWKVDGYDGGVAVFKGYHPASFGNTYYAYLRCNELGEMLELREKQSFTEHRHEEPASTGVYYVRSWRTYRQFARQVLAAGENVGGEFYISLIYSPMVAGGMKVIAYEVERFICWGTPRDVEQFAFWSDYFRNDIPATAARRISYA